MRTQAIPVGPFLDAEIGHRLFGFEREISSDGTPFIRLARGMWRKPFRYSTDIEWGWQVFVWLTEASGGVRIISDMEAWGSDEPVVVVCDTTDGREIVSWRAFPEAICRLALAWLDANEKGFPHE